MKNLFLNTNALDVNATKNFNLSSELLMENAASGMYYFLKNQFLDSTNPTFKKLKILIVCGRGNNGADCLALARMLCGICEVNVFLPQGVKSPLCTLQLKRLETLQSNSKINFKFLQSLKAKEKFDLIIDGIFGAGFKGKLDSKTIKILQILNEYDAIKIACDIPSGITQSGTLGGEIAFQADFTLTMGALKVALFSDLAKDFVGEVHLINLGISEEVFAPSSHLKLLERSDFKPPHRIAQNTNKGDFGHLCVYAGEKVGAGVLSALSGLRNGAGLVSVISTDRIPNLPFSLMNPKEIPQNTTTIALGMGFGINTPLPNLKQLQSYPLLLDADIFYHCAFKELLKAKNIVLTPHPKEFVQILKILNIATISTQELQRDKITYALLFCKHYPNATLVLKGANSLICKGEEVYINPFGNNVLAKGGSGDVLSGMIGAYLAQGKTPLDSAICGVLLHSFCAELYVKSYNNFSLNPLDLIEQIRYI
ncbi:NAD(P)H-hydrate dehydratase [uncultured Helicobacter sp.]|uniref:NAD(P)H-hydrate dehydratase n=1 Tax=uncultured Helicobacter sp. TaxID=175537 RepID=UPI00262E1101|nr:NAD(P)H-hydrate dehydratase [uncultured Helicobacter sp.]